MGFWSKFAKIALPIAGVAAAPFTGGTSLLGTLGVGSKVASGIGAAAGIGSKLAPILGGASKNQQQERILADTQNLQRDQLAQQRFKTNEALPGDRLATGVKASQISRGQPVSLSFGDPNPAANGARIAKFSGGYNTPDLISPETKQQADAVMHQMLQKQMGGAAMEAPALSAPTKEGTGSKILGGAATVASILGALGNQQADGNRNLYPQAGQAFDPNDQNGWG